MTTTNDTPKVETFEDFKAEMAKVWAEAAEKQGRTSQELTSDMITGIITSIMFGRAARKGNVAKTIFWGVRTLQLSHQAITRREAADRKRERASRLASVNDISRH